MEYKNGREIPSNVPVAIPTKFKRPETIAEQVKRMVASQLSIAASQQGHESFEEADDFDVDDDVEIKSKYELDDEMPNVIQERPMTREERDERNKGSNDKGHKELRSSSESSGGKGRVPNKRNTAVSGEYEGNDNGDDNNDSSSGRRGKD